MSRRRHHSVVAAKSRIRKARARAKAYYYRNRDEINARRREQYAHDKALLEAEERGDKDGEAEG